MYQLIAVAMAKNINSDDANDNKNNKTIQIVKIINYFSIQLTYIRSNFIKFYVTNFWNRKEAINNLSHSTAILLMGTIGVIDES